MSIKSVIMPHHENVLKHIKWARISVLLEYRFFKLLFLHFNKESNDSQICKPKMNKNAFKSLKKNRELFLKEKKSLMWSKNDITNVLSHKSTPILTRYVYSMFYKYSHISISNINLNLC